MIIVILIIAVVLVIALQPKPHQGYKVVNRFKDVR